MPADQLFNLSPGAAPDAPRSQALSEAEAAGWELAVARLLNLARVLWVFAAIVAAVTMALSCTTFMWFLLTILVSGPGTAKGRD